MKEGSVVAQRFRLGVLVGAGGMGRVFRAVDEQTGLPVAVKIIRGGGRLVAERLAREVQALTLLDHPGIVRYVGDGPVGVDDYFLAMEWLEGEDLAQRLSRGALTLPAALDLTARIGDALGHAHARNVVHRDVKPANLFITSPEGRPIAAKVVDFGLAKPVGGRAARGTAARPGEASITGAPIGTVGYMAPEQARGERFLDARADVFALGCVLFECLAGRPPFVAEYAMAVLAKILLEEPPPLSRMALVPIPPWVDALVASMLAQDPARRPASGAEVARAIHAHRDTIAPSGLSSRPPPAAAAITAQERRLSTVVAVRPLGADIDETRILDVGRVHGGALEPIVDGTWLAMLRTPDSAVDAVVRAVRLAMALRPFGAVTVATSFDADTLRPAGDVVDRVFAQLDRAGARPAPATLVDELTAGLVDGTFEVERRDGSHWLVGTRSELDPRRPLLGRGTPFVGRDKELNMLLSNLASTIEESEASATFVLGAAGVGKSRLRHEMVRSAKAAHPELRVMLARAEPTRQASALGIMAALVAEEASLREDDPLPARRAKLRTRLARHLAGDTLERVLEMLGDLSGAPPEEPSLLLQGAKNDPRRMWSETRRAFADWLGAELATGPVLLVVEDVQWADAHSLHLLCELLSPGDRPLALLGLGRPSAQSLLTAAEWESRSLQIIQLPTLGRRASEQLVRESLGDAVSADRIAAIVQRGGGHAFFLEELVRAEAEGRSKDTPMTVVAMLQDRIERFEGEARRVLRAASIFGLEFTKAGVAALLGADGSESSWLDRWLETLTRREVIGPAERRRFNREETYAFRHDLVHETIYATLPEEDRRHGHLRAARWLESKNERDAAMLAQHFERGGNKEEAAKAFARAGEQAYKRQDFAVALQLCERSEANGAAAETLGVVRWVQAAVALASRTLDDTERYSMEALELLPKGSHSWFQAMTVAIAVAAFGRPHLLGELVGRLLQTGEPQASELGLPAIQAWALAANMLYMAGQYELAAEFDARITRCAERAVQNESVSAAWVHFARHVRASYCRGDPEPTLVEATLAAGILEQSANEILVWVRIEEGKAAGLIGDFARAESLLEWAITSAADENVWAAGLARHRLAMIHSFQGRHERAIELEKEAIERFHQIAMPIMAAIGDNHMALFELARGNLELADAAIRRAHELLPAVPPLRTYGFATQARIELARGRVSEAIAALEEAEIALPSHGIINDGESVYDIAWIEALTAAGRHDEAKVRAGAAAGRLRERAERITKPEHRISYCDAVPDNARVFALEREMLLEPR